MIIPLALLAVGLTLNTHNEESEERRRTYECGFCPIPGATYRFSLYFFQLALIFLVFDVEMVVIIPLAEGVFLSSLIVLCVVVFVVGLVAGLIHE